MSITVNGEPQKETAFCANDRKLVITAASLIVAITTSLLSFKKCAVNVLSFGERTILTTAGPFGPLNKSISLLPVNKDLHSDSRGQYPPELFRWYVQQICIGFYLVSDNASKTHLWHSRAT
jgi:hypothetical protein